MLKKLLQGLCGGDKDNAVDAIEFPLELEERLSALHATAPVDRHLEMLFRGIGIGE